jgi:molybdate transport system ATP-binding protein
LVGHELQDRYARWNWNFSALDVILSGVYRTDVPRRRPNAAERSQAFGIMRRLEIAHLAQRQFLQLSRGEQRRVLIARGVAFDPVVLLLDEPASGLDKDARRDLERMIERIGEHATMVACAHAAEDLPATARRMLRLERGRIVSSGSREPAARSDEKAALVPSAAPVAAPAGQPAAPLIEITHADVWLAARPVLRDITWRLDPRQHWLITGSNGAGKSSFLRLAHGQLRAAVGGEVRWPALGDPRSVWTLRRSIAWVSPELQAGYRYPTTVRACVASGFESSIGLTRKLTASETSRVEELLAAFALVELADRKLATLSYGQARRALIARALVNKPRVLLLDEPWEGLDRPIAALLNAQLGAVVAADTQLVCASHLALYREHFTHELVLDRGRIIATRGLSGARQ